MYLETRWLHGLVRFLLYFGCSLLAAALRLQYLGVRALSLLLLLLLLGRRRLDLRPLTELLVSATHVTVLLVGGLGWCFLVFVDM